MTTHIDTGFVESADSSMTLDIVNQNQNPHHSEARIKAVEELLVKLTAANESVTADRDREAKKSRLLEKELLALRASTEDLRKVQVLVNQGGNTSSCTTSANQSAENVSANNEEIFKLQKEITNLKNEMSLRTENQNNTISSLRKQLDDARTKDTSRTVVVENTEHVDKLRETIKTQHDEVMRLREQVISASKKAPQVEVVSQERFVELPTVEVRTVEVENVDKITVLIHKCRDLEQEIKRKESVIADWNAKCARLEQTPAKVVPSVVEVEDSKKIRELIDKLNQAHNEIGGLRKKIRELELNPKIEVQYVDREVYIEVPQVEVREVPVDNPEKIQQFERIVALKEEEIGRLREDVEFHRGQSRRLEHSLQEHSSLLRSTSNSRLPTSQNLITVASDTGLLPRTPHQLFVNTNSPLESKLNEIVKSGIYDGRLPIIQRSDRDTNVDLSNEYVAQYTFGTLPVELRYLPKQNDIVVKSLFDTGGNRTSSDTEILPFSEFVRKYGDVEMRTQPEYMGTGSRPNTGLLTRNNYGTGSNSLSQVYPSTSPNLNANNNFVTMQKSDNNLNLNPRNFQISSQTQSQLAAVPGYNYEPQNTSNGHISGPGKHGSADAQRGIDGLMAWVLGAPGDTGGNRDGDRHRY